MTTSDKKGVDTKGFNVVLQYRNQLPFSQSGPYFEKLDLNSFLPGIRGEMDYRPSTLERKYVWQPSMDPFVGMRPNLVDQDDLLRSVSSGPLDSSDKRILFSQKQQTQLVSSSGARGVSQDQKPFWLRNTTYLENNPFNRAQNANEEETYQKSRNQRKGTSVTHKDMLSVEFIEASFADVERTVENLVKQSSSKKRKLIETVPLLPDNAVSKKRVRSLSLARFDEDISQLRQVDQIEGGTVLANESVITNIRLAENEDFKRQGFFLSTLVAPTNHQDEKAVDRKLYQWLRDYRMEVQEVNMEDSFLLVLSEDGECLYTPVLSRAEMRIIPFESSNPHDCIIVRD